MAKAKPNLLLCFDAFGTLFKPKHTVALQYAEVARQCGFTGFTDSELQSTLKAAIKGESKQNPNYGKATGLGATKWWTNVRPLHNPNRLRVTSQGSFRLTPSFR